MRRLQYLRFLAFRTEAPVSWTSIRSTHYAHTGTVQEEVRVLPLCRLAPLGRGCACNRLLET